MIGNHTFERRTAPEMALAVPTFVRDLRSGAGQHMPLLGCVIR
jgi:hypothetical protein